jgi:flagellar biosynthesis/type III secretory pathway protein FliH
MLSPETKALYVEWEAKIRGEGIKKGIEKGRKEGIKEGLKAGKEQGIKAGKKAGKKEGIKAGKEQGIKAGKEQGIKAGKEQGIKEGKEQGIKEGEQALVRKLLVLRFGKLSADAERRIARASLDELERWAERVLTAKNLAAVFAD